VYYKKILFLFILFLCNTILFASNANWMSQIPNDRILNQLIIPGTHDSGTYDIKPQSKFSLSPDDPLPIWFEEISNILPKSIVRPIVAAWSKTQPYSILQQLNNGIRYLDFRVCLYQSHFYLCHALISVRLKTALKQIQTFIQQNPSEIIFLDINHIYNVTTPAQETQLVQLIQNYLGNDEIPNTYHVTDTMKTIRASNRNVIIFMNSQQSVANNFWPESNINSPWPDAGHIYHLENILNAEMLFRDKTYLSSNNFFVLQTIETENTNEVIDGIVNPKLFPNNIKRLELLVNSSLENWINNYIAEYGSQPMNIVIQDWFTKNSPIVQLAVQYDTQSFLIKNKLPTARMKNKLAELKKWYTHEKSIRTASSPSG